MANPSIIGIKENYTFKSNFEKVDILKEIKCCNQIKQQKYGFLYQII